MKKVLKKSIFVLVAAMAFSCTSAMALTYSHVDDTFSNGYFDGWEGSGAAVEAAELDGESVLKLDFGANGGSVVKTVEPADISVFVDFDIYVGDFTGTLTMPKMNFDNGQSISLEVNGDDSAIKKNAWNHVHYNLHIRYGKCSGALNGSSKNRWTSISTAYENTLTSVEFKATADTELYIDNFKVTNMGRVTYDYNEVSFPNAGFVGDYGGGIAAEPGNESNLCYTYKQNWDVIAIPPIFSNETGVIEFDIMFEDVNAAKPLFVYGNANSGSYNADAAALSYKGQANSMWYYRGNQGGLANEGRWSSGKWYRKRVVLDGPNRKWYLYMTTDNSNGEFELVSSNNAWLANLGVVDSFIVAEGSGSTVYIDNFVAWRGTGKSIEAFEGGAIKACDPTFEPATLVVASYADDKLIDVKLVEMTEPCIKTLEELGLNTEDAFEVQAFMLDGLKNITPIGDVWWDFVTN